MDFSNKILNSVSMNEPLEPIIKPHAPEVSKARELGMDSMDILKRSLGNNSIAYMFFDGYGSNKDAFEEDKAWDKEQAKTSLIGKIHPSLIDSLVDSSVSEAHLNAQMKEAEYDSAAQEYLDRIPWYKQFGYAGVAEATNIPIYVGAALAFPATTAAASATFLGSAVLSGTAGVTLEAIKDVVGKEDKTAIDYLGAFLIDGTIGGVLGKSYGTFDDMAANSLKRATGITKEVEEKIAKEATEEGRRKILSDAYQAKVNREMSDSMYDKLDAAVNQSKQGSVKKVWQAVRQDLAYATGKSPSDTMSEFSKKLFPDPTLQTNQGIDLNTERILLEDKMIASLLELQPNVRDFSELVTGSKGMLGIKPSGTVEDSFYSLIGQAQKLKGIFPDESLDVIVDRVIKEQGYKASAELKKVVKDGITKAEDISVKMHRSLKEHGNTQFQEGGIKEDRNYMHFVYDKEYIARLRNEGVSRQQMSNFFGNAIASHFAKKGEIPNIDFNNLGELFYEAVSNSAVGYNKTFSNVLDEIMTSKKVGDETKSLFERVKKEKDVVSGEEAGIAARERTGIDYGYEQKFQVDGGEVNLRLHDLISNNYWTSMTKYARRMAGTTVGQKHKWIRKIPRKSPEQVREDAAKTEEGIKLQQAVERRRELEQQINKAIVDNELFDISKLAPRDVDNMVSYLGQELSNYVPKAQRVFEYYSNAAESYLTMTKAEYGRLISAAKKTKSGKPKTKQEDETMFKHIDWYDENYDTLLTAKKDDYVSNMQGIENQLDIPKKTINEAVRFLKGETKHRDSFTTTLKAFQDRFIELGGTVESFVKEFPLAKVLGDDLNIDIKNMKDEFAKLVDADTNLESFLSKSVKDYGYRKKASEYFNELFQPVRQLRLKSKELARLEEKQAKKGLTKTDIAKVNKLKREIQANEEYISAKIEESEFGPELRQSIESAVDKYANAGERAHDIAHDMWRELYPDKDIAVKTDEYNRLYKRAQKQAQDEIDTSAERSVIAELDAPKYPTEEARTLSTMEDYADFEQQIVNELEQQVIDGKISNVEKSKNITRLRHILKELQGLPTAKEPDSMMNKIYRVMHNMNVGRLLGQTGFTMAAEGATIAVDQGVRNMFKTMPSFGNLLKAYKTGKITNEQVAEIQEFTGMFNELMSSPKMYELSHEYAPSGTRMDSFLGKAENMSQNFAEFTLMMGGVKPMTAMFQAAHTIGIFNKMKKVANGGKKSENYIKMLKELGMSKDAVAQVYDNILRFADDKKMNFSKWDVDTRNMFLAGVRRRTDTLVQKQQLGDQMSWVVGESDHILQSTVVGKILTELKMFSLVSHTKQLGRVINRADFHSAMLVSSWAMALSLSYMAKQHLNYAGNKDKLEEALEPDKMIPAVVSQMPLAGMLPQITDMISTSVFGKPLLGHHRNSGIVSDFFSTIPSVDLANNLLKTIGTPVQDIYKDEVDIDTAKPVFNTLGINNSWLTRPFVESQRE